MKNEILELRKYKLEEKCSDLVGSVSERISINELIKYAGDEDSMAHYILFTKMDVEKRNLMIDILAEYILITDKLFNKN